MVSRKIEETTLYLIEKINDLLNKMSKSGKFNTIDIVMILNVVLQDAISTYLNFSKSHLNSKHFEEVRELLLEDTRKQIKEFKEENNEDN